MSYYILEALSELAPGIDLSKLSMEDREELEKDLEEHVRTCLEFESYSHPSASDMYQREKDTEVSRLEKEVAKLEGEASIYRKDIQRHFGGDSVHADTYTGTVVITDWGRL